MEVRQRPRPTGEQWFESRDLANYLSAFGDDPPALPETMRVLDIIAVDYIIETCYEAESHARHAGRQKVKVDDFQFALRNDPKKLGRIQEMAEKDKQLKISRKAFELPEGEVQKGLGEDGEVKQKGKRGRKRKSDGVEGSAINGDSPVKPKRKYKKRGTSGAGSELTNGNASAKVEVGEDDLDMDDFEDD